MQKRAAASFRIHGTSTSHLLFRSRQIKFRCILHQEDHIVLGNPFSRCLKMGLESFFGRDFIIVKEAIGRFHFGSSGGRRWNAYIRMTRKFFCDGP